MKRRRRRHLTPKAKSLLLSLLIGCIIGTLAGIGHIQSVKRHQAETVDYLKSIPEVDYDRLRAEAEEPAPSEPEVIEIAAYIDPDIPEEVQVAAQEVGKIYDLSPELLEAVAFHESRYHPYAVNGSCTGLMQVNVDWHWDRMERLEIMEAELWRVYPSAKGLAEEIKRATRSCDYVVLLRDADNDVALGISRVQKLLTFGMLSVDPSQEMAVQEFGLYEYDKKSIEKGREVPVKTNDHCMDAIRYLVMGLWSKVKRYLPVQDEKEDGEQ